MRNRTKIQTICITSILFFTMLGITGIVSATVNGGDPGGCTPGYWKNHLETWVPTGIDPDEPLGDHFDVSEDFEEITLLEALSFKGGKGVEGAIRILLRAAVAGLLNMEFLYGDPDMHYPMYDLISRVNSALDSGNRDTMLSLKDEIDQYNNLGIPYL